MSRTLLPFPTINILLGGLGAATGLLVLQLLDTEGEHHRFLAIDSDVFRRDGDPSAALGTINDLQTLQDRVAICRLSGINLPQYRQIHDRVLTGRYLPKPPSATHLGVAKIRMWGSLLGLAMLEQIKRALLTEVSQVRRLPAIDAQVIVVNIIAGLGGGTGSANISKVAAIAYNALEEAFSGGNVKIQYRVWGITPDAYAVSGAVRAVVECNGLLALRELGHIQRHGWDLIIPDGSGQKVISVPPKFLQCLTLIGSYNARTQLNETGTMDQVATAIVVGSDPRMAAAQQGEWVDIQRRFDCGTRFVTAIAAFMARIDNNSAMLASQLLRRKTARLMLALPPVPDNELTNLATSFCPISLNTIKQQTKGIRPAITVSPVLADPSKVIAGMLAEIDAKSAELRGMVTAGVRSSTEAVTSFLSLDSRYNLPSLATGLRSLAASLVMEVPKNQEESEFLEALRYIADKIKVRKAWESSSWMTRQVTSPKLEVEGNTLVIDETVEKLCEQFMDLVLNYWNREREAIIALALNQAMAATAAWTNSVANALNQRHRELEDLATAEIVMPASMGNHNPYVRTFSFRPEDVETHLPRIHLGEILQDHDLVSESMGTILAFTGEAVSVAELLLSHRELRDFLMEALEAIPFLSYSSTAAAGTSDGGPCDRRGYIMGPHTLRSHPRVRDLLAAHTLHWVGTDETRIYIIHQDAGITPGSVSGVQAWEAKAASADLTLAVSDLQFLDIPSLIEVHEATIAPIFLLAMVLGSKTPSGQVDPQHRWSHVVPEDAKIMVRSGRWVYYPHPASGGTTALELGTSFRTALEAFRANVGNVRDQMRGHVEELQRLMGDHGVRVAVERFRDEVEAELRTLDERFMITPDDTIKDSAAASTRLVEREHAKDLQWFSRTCHSYLETHARMMAR